jgi:GTP-binding protein LepA
LEFTSTVEKRKMKEQLLDQMDLERERGITIKLQPVRMKYRCDRGDFVLNLIDTPAHVDFQYEVSRSLAAVEGAVLLVDATKGVQAQTLANLYFALDQDLTIIPVINKVDLPNADIEKTMKEIIHITGCRREEILCASGKTGEGVPEILRAIVERVPAPSGYADRPLRALIFDSVYDDFKGVVAYVRIVDGSVRRDDVLKYMATGAEGVTIETGYFKPQMEKTEYLEAGDIGYIATGLKSVSVCRVGDTVIQRKLQQDIAPLPGYREVRPMVYASFYPTEGDDYNATRDALDKLKLNDAAFVFEPESNQALGRGFRCGFLGMLHLEIVQARLEREFGLTPTITTPSVVYLVHQAHRGEPTLLYSPVDYPDPSTIHHVEEPYVRLEIITPQQYIGAVMDLASKARSMYVNTEYLDTERVVLTFETPLTEIIVNFHDDLKSVSSGFASMNYDFIGHRESKLVKLDILVGGERVDAFSRIVPESRAFFEGKATVEKLKKSLPRQNFAIALQAAVGGKIIARETINPFRKDVTSKLYGGDVTRKRKLLEKQKKGKKRMKNVGKVSIPPEAFLSVLKR